MYPVECRRDWQFLRHWWRGGIPLHILIRKNTITIAWLSLLSTDRPPRHTLEFTAIWCTNRLCLAGSDSLGAMMKDISSIAYLWNSVTIRKSVKCSNYNKIICTEIEVFVLYEHFNYLTTRYQILIQYISTYKTRMRVAQTIRVRTLHKYRLVCSAYIHVSPGKSLFTWTYVTKHNISFFLQFLQPVCGASLSG